MVKSTIPARRTETSNNKNDTLPKGGESMAGMKDKPAAPSRGTATVPVAADGQMEKVLTLMMARTRGEVSSEDVETAVDKLISKAFPKPPQNVPSSSTCKQKRQISSRSTALKEDDEDYDDFDTKVPEKQLPKTATSAPSKIPTTTPSETNVTFDKNNNNKSEEDKQVTWSGPKATVESMVQQDKDHENKNKDDKEDRISKIPLGRSGERMMVTFGDGRNPNPEAVQAALLGARRCLQMAIKDARALRRRMKQEYARARATIKDGTRNLRSKDKVHLDYNKEAVDPTMLYRAISGYDKLSYEPKCGFDVQQLQQLFPEEMNAYERWNQMHNAYKKSKESDNSKEIEQGANDDTNDNKKKINKDDSKKKDGDGGDNDHDNESENSSGGEEEDKKVVAGGHLDERLANFDVRTEQMKDDWYLKFSKVRQGSFLPKGRGKRTSLAIEWDKSRKHVTQKRGRPGNTWYNLSLPSVQFLHWLGFDQSSALPPPNEDTTEALAFLGYDFMGKIVERSIFLRTLGKMEEDTESDAKRARIAKSNNMLFELRDGEQLDVEDIEKAVNDSTVRPTPLYSATDHSDQPASAAQLYFGPGFEERIEMEMDELVPGKRQRISNEEMLIRQKEDELFDRLKSPPKFDNALDMLAQSPVKDAPQGMGNDKNGLEGDI